MRCSPFTRHFIRFKLANKCSVPIKAVSSVFSEVCACLLACLLLHAVSSNINKEKFTQEMPEYFECGYHLSCVELTSILNRADFNTRSF